MNPSAKKIFLSAIVLSLTFAPSVQAEIPADLWDCTESSDNQDSKIYEFKEVEVTIPSDWKGKYTLEEKDSCVYFYHTASREALSEASSVPGGGVLFSLCCSDSFDFMDTVPDYEILGSGEQVVYYISRPTDVQGYTEDTAVWEEWTAMLEQVDWVAEHAIVTSPGEGAADVEQISGTSQDDSAFILPDSSDRKLSKDDLEGLNADELQMAINEIYARHGRKFLTESIQEYFDSKSWYRGTTEASDFDPSSLSLTENENIALMIQCMNEIPSGNSTAENSSSAMTATAAVNIRSEASVSGNILGVVPQGYTVTATGSAQNGWIPVKYNGITGFISQQYLKAGAGLSTSSDPSVLPEAPASTQTEAPETEAPVESASTESSYDTLAQQSGVLTGTILWRDDSSVQLQTDSGASYTFVTGQWTTYAMGEAGDYVELTYLGSLDGSPQIQSMTKQPTQEELSGGPKTVSGVIISEGNDLVSIQTDDGSTYSFLLGTAPRPDDFGVGDSVQIQYNGTLDAPEVISMIKN